MADFNRTELIECTYTHLKFPRNFFVGGSIYRRQRDGVLRGISFLGELYINVSKRTVNGRYSHLEPHVRPTYFRRGIMMDPRWVDDPSLFGFEILSQLGMPRFSTGNQKLSLDRINNRDGYFLHNLRWATPFQQANNY